MQTYLGTWRNPESNEVISRHVFNKTFTVRLPDRNERKDGFQPDSNKGLLWYVDGSKTIEGTGTEMYGFGTRNRLSFSPVQYSSILRLCN
jgi:hypothetical protein